MDAFTSRVHYICCLQRPGTPFQSRVFQYTLGSAKPDTSMGLLALKQGQTCRHETEQ